MRNRTKTIEALRRLAERPGTPQEGETARRLLERFGGNVWEAKPFDPAMFPPDSYIFYCYWCYRNDQGTVCKQAPKMIRGEWWMRIKFWRLKQPRWVPVTSPLGCHISHDAFVGNEEETLYRMDVDWQDRDQEVAAMLKKYGIQPEPDELTSGALNVWA